MWCLLLLACLEPDVGADPGAGGAGGNPGTDIGIDPDIAPEIPSYEPVEPDSGIVRVPDHTGSPAPTDDAVDLGFEPEMADLRPLNGAFLRGEVRVEVGLDGAIAEIEGEGLFPGARHPVRLHQGGDARCPAAGAAIGADALVAKVGPAVVAFEPLIMDHNGRFDWVGEGVGQPDPSRDAVFVVYGAPTAEGHDLTLPAACALVRGR